MQFVAVNETQKQIYAFQEQAYDIIMSAPHNIIFLDIDGVLNTNFCKDATPQGYTGIMNSRVKILSQIALENHAGIILSTSWKSAWTRSCPKNGQADSDNLYMMEKLSGQGICAADKTDDSGFDRGRGIRKWLESHPQKQFIVLDDEIFSDYKEEKILPHLILTSPSVNGGLKPKHVKTAKRLFDRKEI